jgi:hypothetical protein
VAAEAAVAHARAKARRGKEVAVEWELAMATPLPGYESDEDASSASCSQAGSAHRMPVKTLDNHEISNISGDTNIRLAVVPRSGSPERGRVMQPSEFGVNIINIWRGMTVAEHDEFLHLACGAPDERRCATLATFIQYLGGRDRVMILSKTFRTRSVPKYGLMMTFLKDRGLNYHDCSVTGVVKMAAAFILNKAVELGALDESEVDGVFILAVDYLKNIKDDTAELPLEAVIDLFQKHNLCPNGCKGGCNSCK